MKTPKQDSIFKQEMKRDFKTFLRLDKKRKLQFIYDYYRWYILAAIVIIFVLITAGRIIWEGQKPCRLRICAVLNNDETDCSVWFNRFEKELKSDGMKGDVDLNQDQPFDYSNMYYYIQEMEVMTTISSQRMDVAICGPDMYDYLLCLNAALPLDDFLDQDQFETLKSNGMIQEETANLQIQEDGTVDESMGIDGYFAIDITDTAFGKMYNAEAKPNVDGSIPHLYAIVIRNSEHLDDCKHLIDNLLAEKEHKKESVF